VLAVTPSISECNSGISRGERREEAVGKKFVKSVKECTRLDRMRNDAIRDDLNAELLAERDKFKPTEEDKTTEQNARRTNVKIHSE
jgi:hypothetical protein